MQIEPLQVRVARAARSNCGRREPTAKPADLRRRAGAQSHAALHGSAHDAERHGIPTPMLFAVYAALKPYADGPPQAVKV